MNYCIMADCISLLQVIFRLLTLTMSGVCSQSAMCPIPVAQVERNGG